MTIRCSAISLFSAAIVAAQTTAGNPQVDSVFSSFTRETPGCAVGVSRDETVVFRGGYGMADLERNVPITPDSVFESGSVAKQFTAAALMLLAQSGKISLDDPLRKYLPELPDYGTPVTIRHVMHHISGLREWRPIAQFSGFPEGSRVYTNADLLEFASRQRGLNFDPGTNYTYSNTGFNIAAILVERVLGGKTFQAFTKEAIFDPLGMTHTRWRDNFRTVVPNRAVAYKRAAGAWELAMPIENIIGAGGMLTTVDDLLLWNENFRNAKVGGPEFVAAQQKQAVLASGRTIAYAAGLVVGTVGGLREVSHGGATGGYRTWLGRYPDKAVSVAVLCNAANINPTALGRRTARVFTGASEDALPHTTAGESAVWLPGVYRRVRDNTMIRVEVKDGQFALARGLGNEASRTKLYAMGAGRLAVDNSTEQLVCEQSTPVRCRSTADDASVYERAEIVAPTAAELAAYTGDFRSDETLGTMRVSVVAGRLRYKVGTKEEGGLTPTFRDTFQASDGTAFRFIRDGAGAVKAVSTGSDRVWDLRFTRIQ